MYRLGWPLSTLFASLGIPLIIKIEVIHDEDANVYVATSQDMKGLVIEAETLEALIKEAQALIPELLALNNPKLHQKPATDLFLHLSPL